MLAEAAELEKRAAEGAADLGGLKPLGSVEALPIDRVSKASTSKRQDLRGVPFVTIDGEDAAILTTRCMSGGFPARPTARYGNCGSPSRT
ncbi:MAG: hypothetical protein ACLR0N_04330 [Bilophila wadsworthia]